jgi:hypothetical protein
MKKYPAVKKCIDCYEEERSHIHSAIINRRPTRRSSNNKEGGNKKNGTRKEGHKKENTMWA